MVFCAYKKWGGGWWIYCRISGKVGSTSGCYSFPVKSPKYIYLYIYIYIYKPGIDIHKRNKYFTILMADRHNTYDVKKFTRNWNLHCRVIPKNWHDVLWALRILNIVERKTKYPTSWVTEGNLFLYIGMNTNKHPDEHSNTNKDMNWNTYAHMKKNKNDRVRDMTITMYPNIYLKRKRNMGKNMDMDMDTT